VTAAVRAAGEIDVLVSNAGEIFYAAVEATPPDKFAQLLDLNTLGALRVAQAVLPGMRTRGRGRLLFMSSVAGRVVLPPGAAYAATKWALEALVESLAIDVTTYALPDDPYRALGESGRTRAEMMTPQELAAGVVDAAESPQLPLRIPLGAPARAILAARRAAPDTVPFVPGQQVQAVGAEA
jgi:NAD(P)-dependent dehydrogenase (short-subunit alcohol dehydrogenase family)